VILSKQKELCNFYVIVNVTRFASTLEAGRRPAFFLPLHAITVSFAASEALAAQPPNVLTVKPDQMYCNLNVEFGVEI
jgi:hypothetical protein